MYAKDFLFDENRASDFGLIICSFNGEFETASGGNIEYNAVKTPNRDRYDFYGAQFNEILTWNFSICKNPCQNNKDEMYFNQYEESQIAQWLLKQDGYKWFQFDQDGYRDIYYKVQINMLPHQVGGQTVGFDLTVTSDCGYGYTEEIVKNYILNSNKSIRLDIHSDTNSYILPYISLTGSGNFYISNNSDLSQKYSSTESADKSTRLENVVNDITMDSGKDIITGISSPNDFNWYFLRLVNGVNYITTNSEKDINISFTYREPRRVIV